MAFKLEITQVGKFPTSRSLTNLQNFGTHAKPVTRRLTFTLRLSIFDRRNAEKITLFVSHYPFSLSTSFFPHAYSLLSPRFPSFLPPCLFYPSPIFISFPFSPFSFSLLLFSFIFLFFSYSLFLFWMTLIRRDQVGETSPHLPCCHLSTPCYSLIFLYYSLYYLLHHVTHGSM